MTNEEIEAELKLLATKEELSSLRAQVHLDSHIFQDAMRKEFSEFRDAMRKESADFREQMRKEFGELKAELYKAFGDFRTDLVKTFWLTQLSVAGVILVGVGILVNVSLNPLNQTLAQILACLPK